MPTEEAGEEVQFADVAEADNYGSLKQINRPNENTGFASNRLTTTKYNLWNVIPKSLFEQFRKVANFYFLIVAIITLIPGVTSFDPFSAIAPLIFVVGFSIARELIDDAGRRVADNKSNNAEFQILERAHHGTGVEETIHSHQIKVGDVVVLKKNEVIPADCVALMSSEEGGVLYVSTAQLDGETNLKRKLVTQATKDLTDPKEVHALEGTAEAGAPDSQLEAFQGKLALQGSAIDVPIDSNNLILRGCKVKNTEQIHAVVVYTGLDTKIALNMRDPPSKLSKVDRTLNWVVFYVFLVLILLVVVFAVVAAYFQREFLIDQWYLGPVRNDNPRTVGIRSVGTFIVLFSAWIPISLFVSLETVRVFQALFMLRDDKMISTDGNVMVPRATNLNDSLGLIDTILSDKTGTLTRNVMEYVACSVGAVVYDTRGQPNVMVERAEAGDENMKSLVTGMALCHSVVPDYHGENDGEVLEHPTYQGQSPDEVALLIAARDNGVEMLQRSVDTITIDRYGSREEYRIEGEVEFDSDRKRMSMIYKGPQGEYVVFTKGADATMLPRIQISKEDQTTIDKHLYDFAVEGLRTLVFATKQLTEDEFEAWSKVYKEAQLATEGREELLARAADMVESDQQLVGITAVEDKLQDQVPETIQFLREAGIALWVLTGDKRETAENIGYSSNMLDSSMTVVHIESHSSEETEEVLIEKYKEHCDPNGFREQAENAQKNKHEKPTKGKGEDQRKNMAIIIDGNSLKFVLDGYSTYFLQMTDFCKTVICCRVTPMQKALVVRMVKQLRGLNTLAIGDGGNDVSMIQEADVGVGLFGKEGTQAARSADFAIGEFRLLKRLICVHGHWAWVRNPGLINISFYKNVFVTMGQVFYQFFCQFTGTSLHNEYVLTLYNVALTLLNPLFFALLEKDLPEETLLAKPEMYSANRGRKLFGRRTVVEYVVFYALWHSVVTFWGQYGAFGGERQIYWTVGRETGIDLFGFALSTQVVIIALVKMMLFAHDWNAIYIASFIISIGGYFAMVPFYISFFGDDSFVGILAELFSSGTFWFTIFVTCVAAFMLDMIVVLVRRIYFPDAIMLEQEAQWRRKFWRRR